MNIEEQRIALNQKGYNEKRAGNYESSIDCYLNAIQLDPHHGMAYYNLGKVLFVAQGDKAYYYSMLFYLRGLHLFILSSANGPESKLLEDTAAKMIGSKKLADLKKKNHSHVPFLIIQHNIMHHFGRSYAASAPPKSDLHNHVKEAVKECGQDYDDNMHFYRQGLAGQINEYIRDTEGYREKIDIVYQNIAVGVLLKLIQWGINDNPMLIYPDDYLNRAPQ